jgi:hypothetical protein
MIVMSKKQKVVLKIVGFVIVALLVYAIVRAIV